jgi:hypothetical protein
MAEGRLENGLKIKAKGNKCTTVKGLIVHKTIIK